MRWCMCCGKSVEVIGENCALCGLRIFVPGVGFTGT